MSEQPIKTYAEYILPPSVVSKRDVSRLVAEAERLDGELTTAAVHARVGAADSSDLDVSDRLADFLSANQLRFDDSHQRGEIIQQLHLMKDRVPVIHMTFAVEADPESLGQLAQWLRQSIHPQAVIAAGLQPALIAGVYVRTPNHVHDLSLRGKLQGSRDILARAIGAARG